MEDTSQTLMVENFLVSLDSFCDLSAFLPIREEVRTLFPKTQTLIFRLRPVDFQISSDSSSEKRKETANLTVIGNSLLKDHLFHPGEQQSTRSLCSEHVTVITRSRQPSHLVQAIVIPLTCRHMRHHS